MAVLGHLSTRNRNLSIHNVELMQEMRMLGVCLPALQTVGVKRWAAM